MSARIGVVAGPNMDRHRCDVTVGETAEPPAGRHLVEPGGRGATRARAAARLGAATPEERTGFAAIRLVEGRHRSLVFAPGANRLLTWEHVGLVPPTPADGAASVAGIEPATVVEPRGG